MLDRLTGLEVFAKVATAGSLSAAGRAMAMSQTMVPKHIAALEARLGVKLFHRNSTCRPPNWRDKSMCRLNTTGLPPEQVFVAAEAVKGESRLSGQAQESTVRNRSTGRRR
jgi:hypothetical protein